uniref:RUN domain-containing protein n=1 Tax=Angiostrongylus cantonensis TaxID=6313 RepID=A0A0K0DN58_ANGCA
MIYSLLSIFVNFVVLNGAFLTSNSVLFYSENERRNLLTITRLVLRAFLERTMLDSNRILESDTQQISDLLIMLEKVLWHGFKPRSSTPISRLRAFLRLAMMQKKLFDFYTVITSSSLLKNIYDEWALLRQEEVVQLTGSLLGLSVVDCNLALDYDSLQEQPLSIDLSLYIRIPTIPNESEELLRKNGSECLDKVKKMLLDQNNYLEERNRQLQCNVENLKRRLNSLDCGSETNAVTLERELVVFKNIDNAECSKPHWANNKDWGLERERLLGQIVEREDSLRIVQQQLMDTRKINTDLYDKLKLADEKWRKLEKDLARVQQQYMQESETLKKTISNLEVSNAVLQESSRKQIADDEVIRAELEKKYGQHAELVDALQRKQNALSQAESELLVLRRKIDVLEREVKEIPFLKEEIKGLQGKYECISERAEESERALEELGGHLGESKLRMLELAEELLPFSCAHWAKDADIMQCTACSEKFSISKRKHHCRLLNFSMCGSIFCATCSEGRIKLPSNAKPARVCNQCFILLKNRHAENAQ